MKYTDISKKSEKELKEMEGELRASIRDFRFKASERQLKEVRKIREAKKSLARILFAIEQKQA